jgi:hypothetical protein
VALRKAVALWTETTTAPTGLSRRKVIHDNQEPALSFFDFIDKFPAARHHPPRIQLRQQQV